MGQMQERIPWAIGFWIEPDIPDHRFRHPIAFVDSEWDLAERRLVAHHLRSGKRADSCMGYSWCRFHCGVDDAEMGDSDFSDGLWLWPEGLAHYVLEHAVRLPEEFLRHVRHEAEHPGRKYKLLGTDQKFCDYDFWVAWSDEHANPESGFRELEESERKAFLQLEESEKKAVPQRNRELLLALRQALLDRGLSEAEVLARVQELEERLRAAYGDF